MLDRYTTGDISRLSPEAPAPVVLKRHERSVPGGAANVACNVASLGGTAILAGVIGNDADGAELLALLRAQKINCDGVVTEDSRPTTVKHRIMAGDRHQIMRVDSESTDPLMAEVGSRLLEAVAQGILSADIVVFSDYAKGVFSRDVAMRLISAAHASGKRMIADFKPANREYFLGVDVIEPNLKEAREMAGEIDPDAAGRRLADICGADVVLTMGGDGMGVFRRDGSSQRLPGEKVPVVDVSGAGDTVLATLALALAEGMDLLDAASLANRAGAAVVQKPGTATLSREEVLSDIGAGGRIAGIPIVSKLWGSEQWLENNDRYCAKFMSLKRGYQCSLHYHKEKDEMFIITKGHVRFELGDEIMHLRPGDFVRVLVGTKHRFRGIEDSEFIEVSTHHDDADSYRIEESRAADGHEAA